MNFLYILFHNTMSVFKTRRGRKGTVWIPWKFFQEILGPVGKALMITVSSSIKVPCGTWMCLDRGFWLFSFLSWGGSPPFPWAGRCTQRPVFLCTDDVYMSETGKLKTTKITVLKDKFDSRPERQFTVESHSSSGCPTHSLALSCCTAQGGTGFERSPPAALLGPVPSRLVLLAACRGLHRTKTCFQRLASPGAVPAKQR